MRSTKYYSDQTKDIWNSDDKRFSNFIYLRTKIGERDHDFNQIQPDIENSVFRRCIRARHEECKGSIFTDTFSHRCQCLCHTIAKGLSETVVTARGT